MDTSSKQAQNSLFQVYLRLRPIPSGGISQIQESLYSQPRTPERFLTVEPPSNNVAGSLPNHITLHPPSDSRKRAVEKFAFTKVFEENTTQLDIFKGTGVVALVEGVLNEGRDGLIATLGVTGSGKSHTILGTKSQRGLTQLSLDLLFRSIHGHTLQPLSSPSLTLLMIATDTSEAQILSASTFLDGVYGDILQERGNSRAATPMTVGKDHFTLNARKDTGGLWSQWSILGFGTELLPRELYQQKKESALFEKNPKEKVQVQQDATVPSKLPFWNTLRLTKSKAKTRFGDILQDNGLTPSLPKRHLPQRPSGFPQLPDIGDFAVLPDTISEYAILISMYEVYNDRIFDLLSHPRSQKDLRRRPLLFKSTEGSPDRKVVAGLRKIVCGTYDEALMVLDTGLAERRVAGTGSNSVSSRSHGFFCVELKKRAKGGISNAWRGSQFTIVDLAGSERARNAKTAGATLAEAGKINESLMYLGQCLQMQSDCNEGNKSFVVPFRQCKLTELLFSNSFPSSSQHTTTHTHHHRNPQKAVMIVTADPSGDFNATSQILRYSALAREVTVPRIPSVASIIFSGSQETSRPSTRDHDHINLSYSASDIEVLSTDIVRLVDEVEVLTMRLEEEEARRREAEEGWQRADEKVEELMEEREREVREECCNEMERRLQEERRRWMGAWGAEADRNDEHLDRKLDILSKGLHIHEDHPEPTNHYIAELEEENTALRHKLAALEQEIQCRSPTKAQKSRPLFMLGDADEHTENDHRRFKELSLNRSAQPVKSPGKKIRKLTPRTQGLGGDGLDLLSSP